MSKIFNLLASDIIDLELKLEGKLPINRDELLALANSWGRMYDFYSYDKDNNEIEILHCYKKDEYNLSNLDVSEITNFDDIFYYSDFEGDINNWDVSNGTSMEYMFDFTTKFNSPLDKWDVSNVINMAYIFTYSKSFNQPILWDLSNIKDCFAMFLEAKSFENKYNDKNSLPLETSNIELWLKENKSKMVAIDIKENQNIELDNFLLNFNSNNDIIKK